MRIAAELETREVARIATPALEVAEPRASAIASISASSPALTCSGRSSSRLLVWSIFAFLSEKVLCYTLRSLFSLFFLNLYFQGLWNLNRALKPVLL